MGLDMNVFRVRKPFLDENKVYDREDISGIVIEEDDIHNPMFRQIIPYCQKVRVVNHYYNKEKICKDFGVKDIHIGGWCYEDSVGFTLIYGRRGQRIKIPNEVIQVKYTIDREEICYVCEREEVRYWRKAYDVQEWFHDNIHDPIENTGYYILTQEMLIAFNKYFYEDQLPVEDPSEDCALVYWEWY